MQILISKQLFVLTLWNQNPNLNGPTMKSPFSPQRPAPSLAFFRTPKNQLQGIINSPFHNNKGLTADFGTNPQNNNTNSVYTVNQATTKQRSKIMIAATAIATLL